MNQINGNMLFLFNNDTSHCFENNNTGINSTLYWIDWYSQSNQKPFNKFGVVKLINQATSLQHYARMCGIRRSNGNHNSASFI